MKNLTKSLVTAFLIILLCIIFLGFQSKEVNDFDTKPMDVGVVVSDLEKSLDFYTNVIGMTKVSTYHLSGENAKTAGLTDGKALDIVNLKLNNEPSAPGFKLTKIQDVKGAPLTNSFSPGSRYISIFVKDLDPYLNRIKERNIRLLSKINPMVAPEGYKGIVLQDPDGALLELIWLPKN